MNTPVYDSLVLESYETPRGRFRKALPFAVFAVLFTAAAFFVLFGIHA